ncbi:MAG: hypothetical protein ABW046_06130 [Actinoplanes sp.]
MRVLLRVEGLVPAAGLVAFLLIFGILGGAADPAEAARWIGLGALLAPAVMTYAHRVSAAAAGVLGAVLWTPLAGSFATVAVVWAYAGVALFVAFREVAFREKATAPPPGPHRKPPPPPGLPHVGVTAEVLGFTLLGSAAVGLVLALSQSPPWLAAVLPAFGLGCALLARAVRHRGLLRRLFGTPQPVHAVRVVEQLGYVHVLLPGPSGTTAWEFGFDIAEPDEPDEDDEPHTLPGVLYGDPRPGAWCALVVEGRLHVPVGPVGALAEVPYDVVQGLPREIEDDEEQLVDPAALRPADQGVDAFQTREHRIAAPRAWVATVAIGLGGALAAGELARLAELPLAGLAGVVVLAAAAGFEFGWRSQLRPRLRWHAGGVAAVGFRGFDRQPWATDSAVLHDDEGTVVLTAGEAVLTVPVPAPWPARSAQRSADQLVAALRDARARSFAISPLPPPPEIEVPRRPVALYAAAALGAAIALVILG